jgi:hypothetical protein
VAEHLGCFLKGEVQVYVDLLSNYLEIDYLKIYLKIFELEILSRGLTQVFTLTNKNRRRTELNENKK